MLILLFCFALCLRASLGPSADKISITAACQGERVWIAELELAREFLLMPDNHPNMDYMIVRDSLEDPLTLTSFTVDYVTKDPESFLKLAKTLFNGFNGAVVAIIGNFDGGDFIVWTRDIDTVPKIVQKMGKTKFDYELNSTAIVSNFNRGTLFLVNPLNQGKSSKWLVSLKDPQKRLQLHSHAALMENQLSFFGFDKLAGKFRLVQNINEKKPIQSAINYHVMKLSLNHPKVALDSFSRLYIRFIADILDYSSGLKVWGQKYLTGLNQLAGIEFACPSFQNQGTYINLLFEKSMDKMLLPVLEAQLRILLTFSAFQMQFRPHYQTSIYQEQCLLKFCGRESVIKTAAELSRNLSDKMNLKNFVEGTDNIRVENMFMVEWVPEGTPSISFVSDFTLKESSHVPILVLKLYELLSLAPVADLDHRPLFSRFLELHTDGKGLFTLIVNVALPNLELSFHKACGLLDTFDLVLQTINAENVRSRIGGKRSDGFQYLEYKPLLELNSFKLETEVLLAKEVGKAAPQPTKKELLRQGQMATKKQAKIAAAQESKERKGAVAPEAVTKSVPAPSETPKETPNTSPVAPKETPKTPVQPLNQTYENASIEVISAPSAAEIKPTTVEQSTEIIKPAPSKPAARPKTTKLNSKARRRMKREKAVQESTQESEVAPLPTPEPVVIENAQSTEAAPEMAEERQTAEPISESVIQEGHQTFESIPQIISDNAMDLATKAEIGVKTMDEPQAAQTFKETEQTDERTVASTDDVQHIEMRVESAVFQNPSIESVEAVIVEEDPPGLTNSADEIEKVEGGTAVSEGFEEELVVPEADPSVTEDEQPYIAPLADFTSAVEIESSPISDEAPIEIATSQEQVLPHTDQNWTASPFVLITPEATPLNTGIVLGTWDGFGQVFQGNSGYNNRSQAMHLIRREHLGIDEDIISLVFHIPSDMNLKTLSFMHDWIINSASPYIRHRTLAISVVGGDFALPQTTANNGNYLVFTLRYPEDRDFQDYISVKCELLEDEWTDYETYPYRIVPFIAQESPEFTVQGKGKFSIQLDSKPTLFFNSLIAVSAVVRVMGPDMFLNSGGSIGIKQAHGQFANPNFRKQICLAKIQHEHLDKLHELYYAMLELVDAAAVNYFVPEASAVHRILRSTELIKFKTDEESGTVSLYIQFSRHASKSSYAKSLVERWSGALNVIQELASPITAQDTMILVDERQVSAMQACQKTISYAIAPIQETSLAFNFFNPFEPTRNSEPNWVVTNCFIKNASASHIGALTLSFMQVSRYAETIGIPRCFWIKRVGSNGWIVGLAVDQIEEQTAPIKAILKALFLKANLPYPIIGMKNSGSLKTKIAVEEIIENFMKKLKSVFESTKARIQAGDSIKIDERVHQSEAEESAGAENRIRDTIDSDDIKESKKELAYGSVTIQKRELVTEATQSPCPKSTPVKSIAAPMESTESAVEALATEEEHVTLRITCDALNSNPMIRDINEFLAAGNAPVISAKSVFEIKLALNDKMKIKDIKEIKKRLEEKYPDQNLKVKAI